MAFFDSVPDAFVSAEADLAWLVKVSAGSQPGIKIAVERVQCALEYIRANYEETKNEDRAHTKQSTSE